MSPLPPGIKNGAASLIKGLFGTDNRIARRLIVLIIAFSSLITLLISVVQLTLEYRELRDDVDQQFDAINVFVPNISASVWDFDERQIQLALVAMTQQPHIERASVTASDNSRRWSAGKKELQNMVGRAYPLRHESRGESTEIGRLEVAASLTQIYWKVADRALSIVLSNGLKTFVVALFTFYLFRRLVTRRLEELALKVGKLAPDAPAFPYGVPGEQRPMPRNLDELQAVEWVLDNTTHKLGAATAELKNLNRQLVEQMAEKEALLQNSLVGIALLRDCKIASCNRRCEEIFGYEAGAMTGQAVSTHFQNAQDWADIGEVARNPQTRAAGFRATALMDKRDGTQFWAEISGRAVSPDQPFGEGIWIFSDVTDRRLMEAEMVRLRAELWKMLESQLVRHTVAAMAHEVNQPLGSISALCEAAQRLHVSDRGDATARAADERFKQIMHRMAIESERAGAMVRKLMETLDTPTITVEPTMLSIALQEAAGIASDSGFADCEIEIEIDCKADLGHVLVNRQQLEKVLLNLICNAAEAMRQAGKREGRIWIGAAIAADGAHAQVTVRDDGPGIGKEMETQIFHPFVTTKPGNLGMGLTISRSLIEALGGAFWLASDEHPGATFHFTLPLAP